MKRRHFIGSLSAMPLLSVPCISVADIPEIAIAPIDMGEETFMRRLAGTYLEVFEEARRSEAYKINTAIRDSKGD